VDCYSRDLLLSELSRIDSQIGMTLLVKRLSSSMCDLDLEYESKDFGYCQVL
jgi:hypothetical protein